MEKIVKKFNSFEEAEKAEKEYWKELPGEKKLVILEMLRLRYWAIQNARIPGFTPEKNVNILLTNRDEIFLDPNKFIELLNEHDVRYLIVGGYALSFYSRPKFTEDIDFWIEPVTDNAENILDVLSDFGFEELDITIGDLTSLNKIIQLGNAPLRIDLLTSIDGLDFREAYRNRVPAVYFGVNAFFISLNDLKINKKASGRKKDLKDLDWIDQYSKS